MKISKTDTPNDLDLATQKKMRRKKFFKEIQSDANIDNMQNEAERKYGPTREQEKAYDHAMKPIK